jgi:glycine dehydrogenase subunit 1
MDYKYFPHTDADLQAMMEKVGVKDLDGLYAQIPESIRFKGDYQLPSEMSEMEVRQLFDKLGSQNQSLTCFAGYGVYDHYMPSAIPSLLQRSEFLTSYTPYQAEISQGTLHYIFEYQSMMAELTGMDISNASMYDGTTACAEAMMMAVAAGKKANKVLVSEGLNPKTRKVLDTYALHQGIELVTIPLKDGITPLSMINSQLSTLEGVAGVIVQQPNVYGIVEDFTGFAEACHEHKALFIMDSVAADLAVLKTPGEWGADIAVGDGQSLGIPMLFGGPYVGYMCCTEKLIRKMPGRIVGMTKDNRDQRAFVLTLQAREQHIRRQKATSNICSNQSLMALFVTIYLSLMGKQGVKVAAQLSYAGAHYLCDKLLETGKFHLVYDQPFFNEFYVKYDGDMDALFEQCIRNQVLPGVRMGDDGKGLLIAVTEKRTKEEIDNLLLNITLSYSSKG